jgi:branched-chain amino acid transport system substrate-binding protein
MVAIEAIKKAGSSNPADIMGALPTTTYTGVTGDIAFDDIGDAIRNVAYIKSANTADASWNFVAIQSIK